MVRAAIGGEIVVHAIDGAECKLKIPEGAQSGRQLKIKGKGMPVLRGRDQGDLHVQLSVETPQNLTKRQRELLTEFEKESSHHTHPESTGFFARMKELLGK
jgi:molecular chaperone DnaJ